MLYITHPQKWFIKAEFVKCLKQHRQKWCSMFHTSTNLFKLKPVNTAHKSCWSFKLWWTVSWKQILLLFAAASVVILAFAVTLFLFYFICKTNSSYCHLVRIDITVWFSHSNIISSCHHWYPFKSFVII